MDKKKLLSILILIFVLVALPLTLILVSQRQEVKKKAAEVGNLSIPTTTIVNDPQTDRLNVFVTGTNVGYAKGQLTYDTNFFSGADSIIIYGDNANKGILFSSSTATSGVVSFEVGAKSKDTPLTGAFFFISLVPKGTTGSVGQTTVSLSGQYTALVANPSNSTLAGTIPVTINAVSRATPVPIVISGLTHTMNIAPNPTPNVTVTFNTNVAAGSSFVLTLPNGDKICPTGATLAGCTSFTDLFKNTTLSTSHSFVAGSLIPGNYSYTVYAAYQGDAASVVSKNGTFSVASPTPTATPVPIVISGLMHTFNIASNPTPNVTVSFNTSVAAVSSFVLTLPNGDKICPTGATLTCVSYIDSFKNTTPNNTHSFVAGSLIPGSYSYTVYASYLGVASSVVSQSGTFSVAATPTPTPIATLVPIPVTGSAEVDPSAAECAGRPLHCVLFTVTTNVNSYASVVIRLPDNAAVMCPTGLSDATKSYLGCTFYSDALKEAVSKTVHKIPVGSVTTAGTYSYTVYASDPNNVYGGNSAGPLTFNITVLASPTPTQTISACPWDLNGDRTVNQTDLNLLNGCYNPLGSVAGGCEAKDLNHNGAVNALDYSILLTHWGSCP